MATKIVTKNSSTASAVPTASDLVQGELAVNVADKRLFTEDNAGAIVELGTNPTTLTVTGEITANGGIALGDSDKATFGAGDDLQIYHDGSSSFIKDAGTGNLIIQATDLQIANADNTANYIRAFNGGAVDLRYAGSAKLATTSTGIDVTGTATMDGLVVDGTNGAYTISSNGNDFYYGRNGANYHIAGTANGAFNFLTGASSANRLKIASNGDISFYEDTGSTAKLTWSASNESLTLGTNLAITTNEIDVASGDLTLDVAGDIILDADGGDIRFLDGGTEFGRVFLSSNNFYIQSRQDDKDMYFQGIDGGSAITALRLDMSEAGAATFNSTVTHTGLTLNHNTGMYTVDKTLSSYSATNGVYLNGNANGWLQLSGDGARNTRINIFGDGNASANAITFVTNNTEMLRIAATESIFNAAGADRDFRVESDSNTHMLFVDAGANHVGVGTPTPGHPLSIRHSDKADPQIHLETASYGSNYGVKILAASTNESGTVSSFSNIHKTTASINGRSDVLQHISFVSSTVANDFQKFNCGGSTQLTISGGGSVTVAGALSKGSGSFKIDHPLPAKTETHNLVHSFIEGPQADNIYRGKVTLVDGSATVNIDTVSGMSEGTYVLLNTNTQCFTSNESGWTAVKGSVAGNILTIEAQESCSDTISWMVVGERHDQHMLDTKWTDENGKVIVEPLKELES